MRVYLSIRLFVLANKDTLGRVTTGILDVLFGTILYPLELRCLLLTSLYYIESVLAYSYY